MALTIPIPQSLQDSLGASIFKLMQIGLIVKQSNDAEIIIDFTRTTFLPSSFIGGLFMLVNEWKTNGKFVFVKKANNILSSYLDYIKFPDGFNLELNQNLDLYMSKSYIPLVIFPTQEQQREDCISTVVNLIMSQTNGVYNGECKNILYYVISELTNNIADHSESQHGVIFVQSYQTKGFIDITIADNGIGVYKSYEKTTKFKPKNESEAIEMAINGYSTKNQSESRGFGISTTSNLVVNGLNGTFCLWSGACVFIHNSTNRQSVKLENDVRFTGCLITIRLPFHPVLKGYFTDYIS